MMYMSVAELVTAAKETKKPIYELMIEQEMETSQTSREEIWHTMGRNLDVMEAAVNKGAAGDGVYSTTGLTGGEAVLLKKYRQKGHYFIRRYDDASCSERNLNQ